MKEGCFKGLVAEPTVGVVPGMTAGRAGLVYFRPALALFCCNYKHHSPVMSPQDLSPTTIKTLSPCPPTPAPSHTAGVFSRVSKTPSKPVHPGLFASFGHSTSTTLFLWGNWLLCCCTDRACFLPSCPPSLHPTPSHTFSDG